MYVDSHKRSQMYYGQCVKNFQNCILICFHWIEHTNHSDVCITFNLFSLNKRLLLILSLFYSGQRFKTKHSNLNYMKNLKPHKKSYLSKVWDCVYWTCSEFCEFDINAYNAQDCTEIKPAFYCQQRDSGRSITTRPGTNQNSEKHIDRQPNGVVTFQKVMNVL